MQTHLTSRHLRGKKKIEIVRLPAYHRLTTKKEEGGGKRKVSKRQNKGRNRKEQKRGRKGENKENDRRKRGQQG